MMTTMILWRPLTFWDEAQIEFIKDNKEKVDNLVIKSIN